MTDGSQLAPSIVPAPFLAPFVAAAFPVKTTEGELQRFEEDVEVVFGGATQEPDQGVDTFLLVVTKDRGDLALDRLLEREEQATELMGLDVEQLVGARQAAGFDGQLRAGQSERPEQPQPWSEHVSWR